MNGDTLLANFLRRPGDATARSVYADWLESHGDRRADFLRAQAAVRDTEPDDPQRLWLEEALSRCRVGVDAEWLALVEPQRECDCVQKKHRTLRLHDETQDTECLAWRKVVDAIDRAVVEQPEVLSLLQTLTPEERARVITLPPSIAKLKSVRRLHLYGSSLVRLPPEIGEMSSLENFVPYTSYRLHWFPYEIVRSGVAQSTVSTRALYGNYKYRAPFPSLETSRPASVPRACSVCRATFVDTGAHRVWISLRVGTDVLPLLVNACSEACVRQLPRGAEDHLSRPHRGGPQLQQPRRR